MSSLYWKRPPGFVSPYPQGHPCYGKPLHTHTTDKATRQCAAKLREMTRRHLEPKPSAPDA